MATTTVKTIGTSSRDYSTVQSWEDDAPANLVTSDVVWQGQCYNDSEFTAGVTLSGSTSDSTRYKELTCASGQSFCDNANVRTNTLAYNQSNGVGITISGAYASTCYVNESYARVSKVQLRAQNATASNALKIYPSEGGNTFRELICQAAATAIYSVYGANSFFNVAALISGSGGDGIRLDRAATLTGCTIARLTSQSSAGRAFYMSSDATDTVIKSCAAFGFSAIDDGTNHASASSGYNATNLSSGLPGSNNQHSVTYSATTPFTQAGSSGTDFRAIASTSLIDNGYKDATNAPNDISGTARDTSPTIGCWEYVAATSPAEGYANLSAVANLTATGYTQHSGTATLSAVATLAAVGYRESAAYAAISAIGGMDAVGYAAHAGTCTLDAVAGQAAVGYATHAGTADLSAIADLAATGEAPSLIPEGSAVLSAVASIAAVGYAVHSGEASLSAVASMAAVGEAPVVVTAEGYAVLSAVADIAAVGYRESAGYAVLSAVAGIAAVGDAPSEVVPSVGGKTGDGLTWTDVDGLTWEEVDGLEWGYLLRVAARQAFIPGAVAGTGYRGGAVASDAFVAGQEAGQGYG